VTHDLGVVAQIADSIHVMYAGKIVESGNAEDLFYRPQHPYTKGLLRSIPKLHGDRKKSLIPIPGTPPDLFSPPQGCPFAPRCEFAMEACRLYEPPTTRASQGHEVACWLQDPRAKNVEFPTMASLS
ncbi:MAG TPA: oligopeptide/dipeptide ABC transporter ATP-binding protein, partial [Bacillales bacterium]|nr:oligopeptide/dipeptide ABC transporter ATP-binding protein [Bacillales bacterium]